MRKAEQMVAVRGGRMGKAEQGMVAEHENGLCGEGGGMEKAEQGMRMAEHRMVAYPLLS
jgi:hypothetical protein